MRFTDDLWDYSDASCLPDLYQCSGEPVNPLLRQYIFEGEFCEYTEDMRAALKKLTLHARIGNIIVIIMAVNFIIYTVAAFIQNEKDTSLFMFIIIGVLVLVIIVFACREYANNEAVKAADRGEVQCFKYTFYGINRYEISDSDEGATTYYYAKLNDFLVKVSSDERLPNKVVGLVINIKGTDHFYLLQ
ncbi:MAG: hypothetical protein ACI4JK_03080 [Oscillospiraceae bacterium]